MAELPEPALYFFRMPGDTEWMQAANAHTAGTLFKEAGAEIQEVYTADQLRAARQAERERLLAICEALAVQEENDNGAASTGGAAACVAAIRGQAEGRE